jgi:predicted MFS family arabinose efflux permease
MDPVEAPADPGRPSGDVAPDAASRLRRWGPYGLAPVLVLVAASFIDGMESNFIPGVLSLLQDEFHFGDTAAGAIPAAMAIAGLFVMLPAGYLADRTNRSRLLAIVVASWSVLTLASGLATTFVMFFAIRVVLGMAANIDNPLSASLVTDFYPASSRARVFAFIRAGGYIGLSLGVALGAVLGQAFGWRAPFFVMVVPGLVVAFFVFRLAEPPRGRFDAGASQEHALDRGVGALWADCRAVLAVPTLRFLFVGVAVAFAGFNGLAYWLPSFWERQFDLSEGEAGGLTGVLGLTATVVGFWIGGVLGDRWHAERPNGRIELAAITLVVGGALLAVSFAIGVLALQLPLMLCAAILIVSGLPSQTASVADVLPAARRGIGYAVFTFLVAVSSALGPLVVGVVSDISGSLRTALIVMAVPCVPGGLVLARARRTYQADRLAITS